MVMGRPKLLDLFCCEGGAGVGYQRAGFDVTGIDLEARFAKRYPFGFHTADAIEYVSAHGHEFDAIHASPPCQGYTRGNAGRVTKWPKLIPAVREALDATGLPYVIENVEDAGPEMVNPVALCGCMFDLSVRDYGCTATEREAIVEHVLSGACNPRDGVNVHLQRVRMFETNWDMEAPRPCDHTAREWVAGAYGGARRDKYEAKFVRKGGYVPADKDVVKSLLGIEHDMTWNGLFECIPPAYTEHIGSQLVAVLDDRRAA